MLYRYVWVMPLLAAAIWWGMLIAYLACWTAQGKPVYEWMQPTNQKLLFLSNIAAGHLQPIFISCAGAQGLLFVLSLCIEMHFRDSRRLRPGTNNRKHVRNSMIVAITCACIGQLGILFVSIFNTRRYHHVHEAMLVIFIVFVAISSLCSIAEFASMDRDYHLKRHVIVSLSARVVWFTVELAFAIAFGSMPKGRENDKAVMEWCLCFIYPLLMFIMSWDLWPAKDKSKGHYPTGDDSPYEGVPSNAFTDPYEHSDEVKLVS